MAVDGAIVATTDKRVSTKRLAKALQVIVIDGDAIPKLTESKQLRLSGFLRAEELSQKIRVVDEGRRTNEWRSNAQDSAASLIMGMGSQSLNKCLLANKFYAEQIVSAHPGSMPAEVAVRLLYHTAALAAISLDYILADFTFRSTNERIHAITSSIRFGDPDASAGPPMVRAAISLARRYAENSVAVAKQIEFGFFGEANRIEAELIAEYVCRPNIASGLFNTARELEASSSSEHLDGYDNLSSEAKSLLGVFLDFNEIPRDQVAKAWTRDTAKGSSAKKNLEPISAVIQPATALQHRGDPPGSD